MQDILGSIWWLIVALGILVTFHEYGNYLVARLCGVRVLRFSVGFGRALWSRRGRDGTEYVIAALPLGGYVKMLDEREADVPAHQLHEAFNRKPVGQRIAIVAAGPAFNLLLCVLLLWGMFVLGQDDYQPLVGRADGIAAEAGFERDDRIVSIDGENMETWTHVGMALTAAALDRRQVPVEIARGGSSRTLQLDLSKLAADIDERALVGSIGLMPLQRLLPPVIGEVSADSAAADAGLREGDRLRRADGRELRFFNDLSPAVTAAGREGRPLRLGIEREGSFLELSIRPRSNPDPTQGGPQFLIGVGPKAVSAKPDALLRHGPIDALGAAFSETARLTGATFGMLYRMVTGTASLQNLSGPISIAQFANDSAKRGAAWFLFFLAVLSLSLCIMNLLPIPILDGGHLLYYLIEAIKGAPLSEKSLIAGQYVGLVMLGGLMALAFYNDIVHRVLG
jgi:regulator of sigma E protease